MMLNELPLPVMFELVKVKPEADVTYKKKGPLVIHNKNPEGNRKAPQLVAAFRNIPGIELCHVNRLNLLQLAPGGHIGRFIIWTEGAFKSLDSVFGTRKQDSKQKLGYRPPQPLLTNADIQRIMRSDEVQSALRPPRPAPHRATRKKNPLKNVGAMVKLNPYTWVQKRARAALHVKGVKKPAHKRTHKTKNQRTQFRKVFNTPTVAPLRSELEKGIQL
jgi:large subunit ribosomal protein L4e